MQQPLSLDHRSLLRAYILGRPSERETKKRASERATPKERVAYSHACGSRSARERGRPLSIRNDFRGWFYPSTFLISARSLRTKRRVRERGGEGGRITLRRFELRGEAEGRAAFPRGSIVDVDEDGKMRNWKVREKERREGGRSSRTRLFRVYFLHLEIPTRRHTPVQSLAARSNSMNMPPISPQRNAERKRSPLFPLYTCTRFIRIYLVRRRRTEIISFASYRPINPKSVRSSKVFEREKNRENRRRRSIDRTSLLFTV